MPAKSQDANSQPVEPTCRATSALTIKIPEPIIEPDTSITASYSLISFLKFAKIVGRLGFINENLIQIYCLTLIQILE